MIHLALSCLGTCPDLGLCPLPYALRPMPMALGRGFLSYETPRALPWQKPTSSHRSTAHAPPSSHRSTGHRAPTRPCPHRHGSCRPWLHNSGRWTRRSTSSPRDPNKYRHEGSDTHHDHLRKWMELSRSCDGNRYVRKYRPPPKETEHWGGHAWDLTQQCRFQLRLFSKV